MVAERSSLDLKAVAVWAGAGLLAAILDLDPAVRTVLLAPLVLFLPGYALCAGLFTRDAIEPGERLVYSVAASAALAVLGGILVQTATGLDRGVWAVLLAAITLSLTLVAYRRRDEAPRPERGPLARPLHLGFGLLALAIALGIAAWSVSIASSGARDEQGRASFTSLWILPAGSGAVTVGVSSHQSGDASYRLRVSDGVGTLRELELTLAPGETREQVVRTPASAGSGPVEAELLREGRVYRRTYLNREGEA